MNIQIFPPGRRGREDGGQRKTLRNALVRNVSVNGRNHGNVTVERTPTGRLACDCLILNVTQLTALTGPRGRRIYLNDIKPGMRVDALYSEFLTGSRPPQALAHRISVRDFYPVPERQPDRMVQTARIAEVNTRGGWIMTGNPRDINSQTRFNISRDTRILNRNGRNIPLSALRPGDTVRVTHSPAHTKSIPPQTNAYIIQQL